MKTFLGHLLENKDRFIDKNKKLSKGEKAVVKSFFNSNNQAQKDKSIDWNKAAKYDFKFYQKLMSKYPSGRKTTLVQKNIKGLKRGTDYIQIKLSTKDFLAFVPFTHEAAQVMNSKELGVCNGDWCIGDTRDSTEWNSHMYEGGEIPVYVIDLYSKWVVMVQEGNKKVEYWDMENVPKKNKMGIPGFSTRKELLTAKMGKVYDEIREDYIEEAEPSEIDVTNATIDYDQLISDIESAQSEYERASEIHQDELQQIKRMTILSIKEKITDNEELKYSLDDELSDIQKTEREVYRIITKGEIDTTDDDGTEYYDYDNQLYTEDDMSSLHTGMEDDISNIEDKLQEIDDDIDTLEGIESDVDELDTSYEMQQYDFDDSGIDWADDVPDEESIYDDVNFPGVDSGYSDYTDLMEEHGYFHGSYEAVNNDIYLYVIEGGYNETPEGVLSGHELYHPDVVNNQ